MENKKQILLFGVEKNKEYQIQKLCSSLQIQTVVIKETQYLEKIGVLAGVLEGGQMGIHFPVNLPGEMMVFSGIDDASLDRFLKEYKQAEIPAIALKAVLTPYNIEWTALQLFTELKEEHENF